MSFYLSDYHRTSRGTLRWHDLLPLRDAIDQKTAGINADYDLVFGDEPETIGGRECATGYTDFEKRRCWLNAEVLPNAPAADQFAATVFLAAHERAHARWTDFVMDDFYVREQDGTIRYDRNGKPFSDVNLHQAWNILEDERIERLVGRDFPHLHKYLKRGNRLLLSIVPELKGTDDPSEVLTWVLRRRLSTRAGTVEPCPLSESNLKLLEQCEPLIEEAFSCTSSRRVVELAREILKILELDQDGSGVTYVILSGQKGKRNGGDKAEQDGASEAEGELYAISGSRELSKEIEEMLSSTGYSPDVRRGGKVPPSPYLDLLNEVRPYVNPVRHLFQVPPSKRVPQFEESGSRLSIRAAKRTPKTPFRVESPPTRRGNIALSMVIDDSGSMCGSREQQAKLTALLCHEALSGVHRVRAVLAPSGRVVADRSLGEMSRAYIAGYDSNSGTEYCTVMAKELKQLETLGRGYTRYLILIADGASDTSDGEQCRALVTRARKFGIHTLGIGLELDIHSSKFFEGIFGSQYIDLSQASELPGRMQALLRRVAHNKNHRGVA